MQHDSSSDAQTKATVPYASNCLGWKLLEALLDEKPNPGTQGLTVSAASITLCLALLAGGAMDDKLQADFYSKLGADSLEELNSSFSDLLKSFNDETNTTIAGGNAVYFEKGFEIAPAYREHLERFRALVNTEHEKLVNATDEINAWVSQQTQGMIPEIVNGGMLIRAHIVLLNALSFKGLWETQFNREDTMQDYQFHLGQSKTCKIPMMLLKSARVLTARGPGYTVIRLPYKNDSPAAPSLSFIGYLPDSSKTVSETLAKLPDGHGEFNDTKYSRFGLPRFEVETELSLLPILNKLDYPVNGSFSGMGGPGPNLVNEAVHKTKITVDEEGTRAAAVTAITMTRRVSRMPPDLFFDRPFIFSIVDGTGLALFTGVFSPSP